MPVAAWSCGSRPPNTVPRMLDAVLLTHLHSDHINDLNDVVTTHWVMSFGAEDVARVRAAPHQGSRRRACSRCSGPTSSTGSRTTPISPGSPRSKSWRSRPASSSRMTACASSPPRPITVPSSPPSATASNTTVRPLRIAGDTVPCAGLDDLCRDAERLRPDRAARRLGAHGPLRALRRHDRLPLDRRPGRADCGTRANVGTLVLTHQIPTPAPGSADEWIAIAREHYSGEIVFAEDLTTVTT